METREQIEAEIQSLRQRRGAALASGKSFSNASIVEAEQRLNALEDLEAEQARQAREKAAKSHEAQIAAARREVEDLRAASAKALSDSRTAYHQGATAMRLHLETEASLRKAQNRLNKLSGEQTPIESQFELERKRSLQIAAVGLKPINNHPSRFGNLTWPMATYAWKE